MDKESQRLGVTIDNGSFSIKAGLAGEDAPSVIFPSMVGRSSRGAAQKDSYVGDEAQTNRDILTFNYPIRHGLITDWDDMEKIWQYIYQKLKLDSTDCNAFLTEVPMNAKDDREKMAQIMFETFGVPGFYVALQALMPMYATGRTNGIALDIGDGTCYTVPVLKGKPVHRAINRLDYSGSDLTDYLMKMLIERGHNLTSVTERETVRDIKEKLCYVALDYQQEMENASGSGLEKQYTLPDKNVIALASERFHCPEVLFQPHLIGKAGDGIHQKVFESIMKCDVRSRRSLFGNIVVAGGSTLFPGLAERMQKELSLLAPADLTTKVIAPPERGIAAWIGASTVASLPTFDMMWITKALYDDNGPNIVNQKCV